MTTRLQLVAIVIGFFLAVSLSSTIALLFLDIDWQQLLDLVVRRHSTLMPIVAISAGFHTVAGGLYILSRSRVGRHRPVWARIVFSAGIIGLATWIAIVLMIWGISAAYAGQFHVDTASFAWFLAGPLCFLAGVMTGELFLRAFGDVTKI